MHLTKISNNRGGLLIILLMVLFINLSSANKYNVTLAKMDTCKEFIISGSGYLYKQFFHINQITNKKINDDKRLHLKFYVLAAMDAHILLSATDNPRPRDNVYEIVIGAGKNSFSTIRSHMGSQRVSTNTEPDILSVYDPTPIEIIQTKDGTLSVYITGYKTEPFLSFFDPEPLEINYLSFSTFGSASAKWFYDCQFDGFAGEMEEEVHPLDKFHALIANLTKNSDNESVPLDLKTVNFAFQLKSVAYNHEKSILHTRLQLSMYWEDSRLTWDAYENGLGIVTFNSNDVPSGIWKPDLIVLNAAHHSNIQQETEITYVMHANGSISMYITNIEFTTWCVDTKRNWPHERLNCGLLFGLKSFSPLTHAPIILEYDNERPLPVEPLNMLSEWNFRQISLSVTADNDNNTDRYGKHAIAQTINGDISLEFTIERNGVFYKNVFMMPIVACETLIILSFCLRGYRRGGLILVVFLVISLGLIFITKHAPSAYIPNTLHAYRHVMRTAIFCYLLHVALMWLELYPPKAKPMDWMMTLINVSAVRLLLCMRVADCDEYVNIQMNPWRELAKIINNCCFIVISILFIVIDILLLPKF